MQNQLRIRNCCLRVHERGAIKNPSKRLILELWQANNVLASLSCTLFSDFSSQCVGVSRTEFSLMVVTIVAVVGEKPEKEIAIFQ